MTSKLEQRIMKKVMMISFFRELRRRTPIKVLLLAIILSFSTKVISYKVILSYLSEKNVLGQISYLFSSLVHTSIVKIIILASMAYLAFSICRGIVKAIRNASLEYK